MIDTIIIINLIFWALGFSTSSLVLSTLEKKYPNVWKELGCPTLFYNKTFFSGVKYVGFLFTLKFRKTNDRRLIFLCYVSMLSMIAVVLTIILLVTGLGRIAALHL